MELSCRVVFRVFLIILVLFIIGFEINEARGGRGGGGSRGGSRSGSRTRTSRTSSSRTRMYRGPSYSSGSWKTAAAVGTVYGLMSYKRRSIYRRYPDREPTICFNEKNLKNGTYGYFICPQPTQNDTYSKCCGSSDEERCCNLADYAAKKKSERIVGIVFGVIAACVAIGVFVYCCIIKKRREAAKSGIVLSKPVGQQPPYNPEQQPLNYNNHQPGNYNDPGMIPLNTYSDQPQPYMPPPPGGMMPPPPGGMMPPPQGAAYPPGDQGLPYAMKPGEAGGFIAPPAAPYAQGQTQGQGPIGFDGSSKGYMTEADMAGGPLPYTTEPNRGAYSPPSGKGPLPEADVSDGPYPYPSHPDPGAYPPSGGPTGNVPSAPPPPYSG